MVALDRRQRRALVPQRLGDLASRPTAARSPRPLAERLAAIEARPLDDPEARLAAFPHPEVARRVSAFIDRRAGPRRRRGRHRGAPPRRSRRRGRRLHVPPADPRLVRRARRIRSPPPSCCSRSRAWSRSPPDELLAQPRARRSSPRRSRTIRSCSATCWPAGTSTGSTWARSRRAASRGISRTRATCSSTCIVAGRSSRRRNRQREAAVTSEPSVGVRGTDLAAWADELDGTRVVFGAGALAGLGAAARDLGLRSRALGHRSRRACGRIRRRGRARPGRGVGTCAGVRRRRREPDDGARRGRAARGGNRGDRRPRRRRWRERARLRQGHQLPRDERRSDGGLLGPRHGATRPMLPSIGVPTTAGTGSEAQSLRDPRARGQRDEDGLRRRQGAVPHRDPRPGAAAHRAAGGRGDGRCRRDLARGGELRHAAPARRCRSCCRARPGGCSTGASRAYLANPTDGAARASMLLGSYLAGAAIEHSMLGAAHACANPLTRATA